MGTGTNIPDSRKPGVYNDTDRPIASLQRSVIIGFITSFILAFLFGAILYQRYSNLKHDKRDEALTAANNASLRLQESLTYSLSATKTLAFFIEHDGYVKNFDSIASEILIAGNGIDALQLAPGGIIHDIYPLKGNEKVIGYNILKDPTRNKEAFKAIEKRELYFAGPFTLIQGGKGVVGRLPVFRNNKFWGFSAVVIKMPNLLKAAGIDSTGNSGYYFQLSKINPDTKEEEFFIPHAHEFSNSQSVSVMVPNGEWKLSAIAVKEFKGFGDIFLLAILGLLFSVLGGVFVFSVSRRPQKLNELVKIRTKQLQESEENYKILFERSPLPLWIYDVETLGFLEVNDAAINLYGYSRQEFLEMDLMAIRREEDIQKFLDNNKNTTDELRQSGVWTHLKKNKKEIQVLIFSKSIFYKGIKGRLVLLMDVSEKTKVENELIKSEEKYRSLIEQASDGIILYSFDGTIHSFNKAAYTQTGYSREEFEKLNLKDLFFEKGVARNRSKDNKINADQTTTLYRKLKRKDSSVLLVELNARMLPDGKILAIVRDITEREKIETALKESELKYRSLIEQASDGIVITDLAGNIQETNNSISRMSGFSIEEMLGKHLNSFLPEEDAALNPLRFEELKQGQSLLYERRLIKKDGTFLEVEVNSKMASTNTLIGFIRDITERKKNDDILRYQARLLDGVSDAITSLDMNRQIVSWNQACEELYGFTTKEVMGKRIPELVTFEFPNNTNEEVFKQVFDQGQWKGEFNFTHPKTTIKTYLLSSINLLKNKEGNIIGFIITSKDITDRKKAEEEINKSNERFELIAEATNDAVWDHDFVKNETWGNKKLYSLYGIKPGTDKINFEMFFDRIHPDEREDLRVKLQTAIQESVTSLSEEFRFKTVNEEYKFFYDRAYIKYGDDGKPQRVLGAMHDITDREIIKKQILKEKELSDSIINSLPGVFYLYTTKGKFLRWNKNFETVTGYTPEEISQMHPLDFFAKEDQELLTKKIENVFIAGADDVEADFLLKNKQKIPYYFTGQAIEYEGEICLMGVGLDFSEKEKAEKIIRESEEKYRTLVEQASDGIFIADNTGHFIIVNSCGVNMSQYSQEELAGMSIYDLVLPDDIKKEPFHFSDMENNRVARSERRMKRKDGSLLEVEITAKFISGERFLAFVRDVSESKKADKALRESEERYRALVENAPEALVVMDVKKQKFVSISESATRLFKMPKEALLKVGPIEVSPEYQPDGRLSSEVAMENIQKAIDGGKPVFEWTHCDKDGNLIPCEIWLVRLPSENEILIRGSIVDITERKKAAEKLSQSEQKYRLLFYNNPLPMWMTTLPGLDIIDVNESAIKQYGYTREEFLKLNTKKLRPAEDLENFAKEVDKMVPGEINIRAWRHKKKDGTIIQVETYSHQIMYEGRLVWLGLSHDVTESYKAKELLQKSYEDIRQLASNLQSIREDERTNIAREIHDELGQQLTGLKMDMHWLTRKIKNADEEVKKKMEESIELINATIISVRKIATDLRPSILDDLGLLAALEWQSEEFEKRSGIKVTFINEAGDITVLPEVTTALFRVYQELLTNVARHSNADLVTASLYIKDKRLYFSIADNGIGFNTDTISKKKTLGLLGIKERSLLIGGTYEIKSKPGEGTFVLISVPL